MLVLHHKSEVKRAPSVDLRIGKFVKLSISVKTLRNGDKCSEDSLNWGSSSSFA